MKNMKLTKISVILLSTVESMDMNNFYVPLPYAGKNLVLHRVYPARKVVSYRSWVG
jgi:hypothetical protein